MPPNVSGPLLSPRNMKPTKPQAAVQISDADRKRKVLIADKFTMTFKKWRENHKATGRFIVTHE